MKDREDILMNVLGTDFEIAIRMLTHGDSVPVVLGGLGVR
jgi:hypothetical protein